ncbi:MAG TPA: DUF368 domain-containing protein [Pseudogracilibacillus sp.]|nr:DUF368 domain-containing protein [Pseudogracilibacillus sp.]
MNWKNIYRGMAMGISDVVPGVSGGTIAVILGFYDQLIAAINGVFSRDWKKHITFLIPIAIGMGSAIIIFSRVMKWLLAYYSQPTYFFFIGLIIGILPYLFRESDAKNSFRWHHYVLLLLGVVLILLLPIDPSEGAVIENKTFNTYVLLFFSGMIASAAMILPGISGSLVLLVIGVYATVIHAVTIFEIDVILIVGTGIAIGMITMSKIIHYFLQHYRIATFALIIGLVIGSVFVIFPGWAATGGMMLACILVFFIGLLTAYILGKVEY